MKRPSTVEELLRLPPVTSADAVRYALAFRPRPTDVLIATYPKSGTTWLQQIVHGLLTRGSMDFEEITLAVPWIEIAFDLGIDLDAFGKTEPRVYKTHLGWDEVPKGAARYIVGVRDPRDVLVSFYHFLSGLSFEPGSIPIETFAKEFFMKRPGRGRYWHNLASWWEQRSRPDILMVSYENMKLDLPKTIRQLARFIGCELDDALLEIVTRQSSLEFMSANDAKFDEHVVHNARNPARGLPAGGQSKVRTGRAGQGRLELSDEVVAQLDAIWREEIESKFGLPSYDALRQQI